MEILDRYLEAVKKHLPWEGQDDILAELAANLEAQLEGKETQLGRGLTNEEAEEWLKQIGSPIMIAARYQRQQYLIGPGVFPVYWHILRLTITWCAIIYTIAKVVEIAAKGLGPAAVLSVALGLPWVLLIDAALVTLVFAVLERVGIRNPEKGLPFAPIAPAWSPAEMRSAVTKGKDKHWSFAKALAEVIFGYFFLAWLLLVPHYPFLLFGPGQWYLASLPYKLASVWWTFYWCIVGLNAFELAWKTVSFARGTWERYMPQRHLAMHLVSLIPLSVLLTAPHHTVFLAKNAGGEGVNMAQLSAANKGVHTAIAIAIAVVVIQLALKAGKMGVTAWRKRVAAK
jgi:hypothetical protein